MHACNIFLKTIIHSCISHLLTVFELYSKHVTTRNLKQKQNWLACTSGPVYYCTVSSIQSNATIVMYRPSNILINSCLINFSYLINTAAKCLSTICTVYHTALRSLSLKDRIEFAHSFTLIIHVRIHSPCCSDNHLYVASILHLSKH